MFINFLLINICVVLIDCKSLPPNNTAVLITEYAKVAHWGAPSVSSTTEKTYSEGRSHSGQSLWTHRSDVNIASGQDLNKHVTYQYPIKKDSINHNEKVPGVGEVIQDRFNPRPYFGYSYDKTQKNQQTDNFPVYNPPPPSIQQPDSPSIVDTNPDNNNNDNDNNDDDNNGPNGGYSYAPPENLNNDAKGYPSLGPPLAPHDDHDDDDDDDDNNGNVYYPPSNQPEVILDHPPPGYKPNNNNNNNGDKPVNGGDIGEQDLVPPPSSNNGGYQEQFPQYLYNEAHGHDFGSYYDHHHVYKEITTTTEAPEDERVNKGQYSYYYLGRKLWYIPLYFSLYFMVYVFVLILKSIARHKVHFKENLHDAISGNGRHARILTDNNKEKIDQIHNNFTTAINNTRKRFVYVAM